MKRADDVVACGCSNVADDVDDVGNTQGSVDEVGCVDSEGGGGKEDLSPPPSPPVIPSKAQGAPHRMFSVGLPPVNCER